MEKTAWAPKDYSSLLDVLETETAIKLIKDFFQMKLAEALNLKRVTAPLLVRAGTGINDDLNGVERPVRFRVKNLDQTQVEIVQSLAKWKRLALKDLNIPVGEGIYADMNAVRPDETLDHLHSLYVDQWDWERVICDSDRNLDFLMDIVNRIYAVLKRTEHFLSAHYPEIRPVLPEKIAFIHSSELQQRFPHLSPAQREHVICRDRGAVFVIGIGAPLADGIPHDGRAPDYDDWSSLSEIGPGFNGDILVWHEVIRGAVELSSMGIRVDRKTLDKQLRLTGNTGRCRLYFHRRLLAGDLPLSIGGGIGQSRLCMFLLKKAHIGEVQSGIWPEKIRKNCSKHRIFLL